MPMLSLPPSINSLTGLNPVRRDGRRLQLLDQILR